MFSCLFFCKIDVDNIWEYDIIHLEHQTGIKYEIGEVLWQNLVLEQQVLTE